jgi:hypothetical protein
MATASTMACAPQAPARSAGPEAVLACHRDRLHTVAGVAGPGVIAQGSKRRGRHFRRPRWNLAGTTVRVCDLGRVILVCPAFR